MVYWDDYRVVLAVARERTLSAAARKLRVDQSTIGRRLAALEAAAGSKLFDRTADGFALTAAGTAVLPSLEQLEHTALRVEQTLQGRDVRLEGKVRLATSDSFAAWFVLPRLAALRTRHPGIAVELVTGNRPVDLSRREADVSLRMSKPVGPQLLARRIGRGAWGLYASAEYIARRGAVDPRGRLAGHDVVALDHELEATVGARWLRDHGQRGEVVLLSNSLLAHAAAVVAGLGVGTLPCVYADVEPSLRRVGPGLIGQHDVWLVVHPNVKGNARVRAVMDFLTERVEQEGDLLTGARGPKTAGSRRSRRTTT